MFTSLASLLQTSGEDQQRPRGSALGLEENRWENRVSRVYWTIPRYFVVRTLSRGPILAPHWADAARGLTAG